MIAKLIAHGSTREDALDRLRAALAETEVGGVVTNLPFLRWLVAHPALRAGETTTAFLTEHPPLSRAAAAAAGPPVARRRSGSTCRRRRPHRRPTRDAAHASTAPARAELAQRADAGHGDPRPRRARATASRRASRWSCSRR